MWPFNRRAVNRRVGRRHVLDVKLRADVVRRARLRWTALLVCVVFGTVLGVFVLWRAGEWAMFYFLTGNSSFAIQQIDVQTDGDIAPAQLQRWARVNEGQNLLGLDLSRVKRDLELIPQVKTATVERVLPHMLRIRVFEREPLAQVHVPQARPNGTVEMTTLYLDEESWVMPPLEPSQRATPQSQPPPVYPVITGIDLGQVAPGRPLDQPQVASALRLIVAFDRSPMVGIDDLRQIDVASPQVLEVHTALGADVTFSVQALDHQLRRWRQVYDLGQRAQRSIAALDLAVSNSVPARWIEASAGPQTPPRAVRPQRPTRRRNV